MYNIMKYVIILDTETAVTFGAPFVYDIGFIVADLHGNVVYKFSSLISEVYQNKRLMSTAYYSEKIPMYNRDVRNGKRSFMSFETAKQIFKLATEKWNVKEIYAYNVNFDIKALNNTSTVLTGQKFFKDDIVFRDIWSMASVGIMSTMKYFNFAVGNGLVTEKGNLKTSAEACYKFLTDEPEFVESHTGLEDCLIEYQILIACRRKKKKLVDNLPQPWRTVNKLAREKGVLK